MGCDVEVFEQAPELKELGAGLQLAANGTRALYALGVGEELKALSCEAEGKEIRLWNSGERWKLHDLGKVSVERYGYPISRSIVRIFLGCWSARCAARSPAPSASARNASGSNRQGSGDRPAGGRRGGRGRCPDRRRRGHSRVRQGLFGPDKPEFTGVVAWRGIVPMEALPRHMARMVGSNWVGPGGHVVHYPLRAGKVMNFVGAQERSDWRVESWSARGTRRS
jgi:salicylate hydroxylase